MSTPRILIRASGVRALILAGLALAVTTLPGCRERFVSHYVSLDEARRDGAIERGWVPAVLPSSATDIHEAHDLDTNETCGRFTVPPDALDAWASAHLERLPAGTSGLRPQPPTAPQPRPQPPSQLPLQPQPQAQKRPASWCDAIPDWLRFQRAVLDAGDRTLDLARLKGRDSTLVGLDTRSGHVYFWTP